MCYLHAQIKTIKAWYHVLTLVIPLIRTFCSHNIVTIFLVCWSMKLLEFIYTLHVLIVDTQVSVSISLKTNKLLFISCFFQLACCVCQAVLLVNCFGPQVIYTTIEIYMSTLFFVIFIDILICIKKLLTYIAANEINYCYHKHFKSDVIK